MKPDWKDAPEWAKYLAMDADGDWVWYEEKPVVGTLLWFDTGGKYSYASRPSVYWKNSLEQRPETSGTTSGGAT